MSKPRSRDPLSRALEILNWMIDSEQNSWGLREIASGVGMHPSTVHRLLTQLEAQQYLQQDASHGRYFIGLEFHRLVWRASGRQSIRTLAHPSLRNLVDQTGESALLALYDSIRMEMLHAESIDSDHPIRLVRPLGVWLPITAGSTGLAIMAHLTEEEQQDILSQPLEAKTPTTITDPVKLQSALEEIRARGYSFTRGQRTEGAVGIAAPILGSNGRVIGAVAHSQPEQRFNESLVPQIADLVMQAANEIGELLRSRER